MPKMKTHRGAAKRIKVTGTGKFKRHHAFKSHILGKKTAKRKRGLRKSAILKPANHGTMRTLLPYL
ncbi:MAG: 50S ribosomal protein L35 [Clostridiales bacterium]